MKAQALHPSRAGAPRYRPPVYPFTALVGQELMKKALILNAVNRQLCGVLIRGDKGTAKSTAVRGLAALLPPLEQVADCPFHCDPRDPLWMCSRCRERLRAGEAPPIETAAVRVVELPLNTTEDRLVGSLDFEHALLTGSKRFQPGLLAEANRGIIYIDEVNLLEDHLVDILLDTAVTGINLVERESVSFIHPARYILIATMNPEEGDIRPQLLDRFGLSVNIEGILAPEVRMEIARRREAFDLDARGFRKEWSAVEDRLQARILEAERRLPRVKLGEDLLREISLIAAAHHVAGHRADIMMEKTARTLAALAGRERVIGEDLIEAAELVLPHRSRSPEEAAKNGEQMRQDPDQPGEGPPSGEPGDQSGPDGEDQAQDTPATGTPAEGQPRLGQEQPGQPVPEPGNAEDVAGGEQQAYEERLFEIGKLVPIPTYDIRFARDSLKRRSSGRRTTTTTDNKTGRYVRATEVRQNNDLAFDATLRAAAPFQRRRPASRLAVKIEEPDIREKIRQKKTSNLLLFLVDASGSMGTRLMSETKGAILALLLEAYQKRDKVGLIAFKGIDAEVLLPPTNSIEIAKRLLEELPTGGKTPLGEGLLTAYQLLKNQLRQDPNILPLLVVVTDGRANVGLFRDKFYDGPQFGEIYREIYQICDLFRQERTIRAVVVDAEEKRLGSFGRSKKLAEALNAKYYVLEEVASEHLVETVRESRGDSDPHYSK